MAIVNATDSSFNTDIKEGAVLVDFWAPWCGPCKMLAPVLEELDASIGDKVKIVKVNVEEAGDTASKFAVQSIPTMVFFKDGVEKDKVLGFKPKDALLDFINKNL